MKIYKRSDNWWRVVAKIRGRWEHRSVTRTKRDAEQLAEVLRVEMKASADGPQGGAPTFCDACRFKTNGVH
jgi:hypothetical protein